jgi:hypothetical protein
MVTIEELEAKLDAFIAKWESAMKPPTEAEVITRPTEGKVKPGGWGGNVDPDYWTVEQMKDNPALFKIIDKDGKNIATDFSTKEIAEQYIKWFVINENPDEVEPEPGQPGGGGAADQKPPEGYTVVGPYPAIGKELGCTKRRAVRHYQSGKDDDETVEQNCKNIKYRNHQFITYVTMGKVEHRDSVSQKLGGTHMGTGWFDNTVFFDEAAKAGPQSGGTGLGTEKKHPSADLEIIKGPKLGDILNKELRMCCVYRADENKVELWTDFQGSGWKKQVEGTNVGGFNPKASTFECQLRIDGFAKSSEPKIPIAVVQQIA